MLNCVINCQLFYISEFDKWKEDLEGETDTNWVIHSSHGNQVYYRCNRSGNVKINCGVRDRNFKGTVSTRTNTECVSHLVLTKRDDRFHVKFCTKHTSHPVQKEHLRISD